MHRAARPSVAATLLCLFAVASADVPPEYLEADDELLVATADDFHRVRQLFSDAPTQIDGYLSNRVDRIRQGFELGGNCFRTWYRDASRRIEARLDDTHLEELLDAGLERVFSAGSLSDGMFQEDLRSAVEASRRSPGSVSPGDVARFLDSHRRSVRSLTAGLGDYAENFRRAHPSLVRAAEMQLVTEARTLAHSTGQDPVIEMGPETRSILRQAGVPDPGSAVVHELASRFFEGQVRFLLETDGVDASRASEPEAPDMICSDVELAGIESDLRQSVLDLPTAGLLQVAVARNRYLFHSEMPLGPCYRAALAQTLIEIHETVDQRVQQADLDSSTRPVVHGLEWEANDPLGGSLEAIAPFSMRDPWERMTGTEAICTPTEPRHPTDPTVPVARITWHAGQAPRQPVSPFVLIEPGTVIVLDGSRSSDRSGSSLEYAWRIVSNPPGSANSVEEPTDARTRFTIDREGTYVVELVVTNRAGISTRDLAQISTGGPLPPPSEDPPEEAAPRVRPCPDTNGWLERARRDTQLSPAMREILTLYPRLDPRFLPHATVRSFQRDTTLAMRHIEDAARRSNPNGMICTHLRMSRDYEAFRSRIQQFREEIRLSNTTIMLGPTRCGTECSDRSCVLIKDQWFPPVQRDPDSVYSIVLEH